MSNTQATDKEEEKKNSLGLSSFLYGLGNAAKDGFISFVVATAALLGVLTVGDKIPGIGGAAKGLSDLLKTAHDRKYGLVPIYEFCREKNIVPQIVEKAISSFKQGGDSALAEKIALSAIFGSAVSHVVTLPSIESGRKKLKEAIKTHDAVLEENKELKNIVTSLTQNPDGIQNPGLQKRIEEILSREPAGFVKRNEEETSKPLALHS